MQLDQLSTQCTCVRVMIQVMSRRINNVISDNRLRCCRAARQTSFTVSLFQTPAKDNTSNLLKSNWCVLVICFVWPNEETLNLSVWSALLQWMDESYKINI